MQALGITLAIITGIALWVCGVGTTVSVIAAILKFLGVGFLAPMSYWMPLKFMGGYLVSLFGLALSAAMLKKQ